jgi:serine/threonine-protein phosphatase 2A regulatory subunit B'
MAELEELLLRIGKQEFGPICVPLFRQLAKCASSQHSRVAERAIQLWNNEQLLALMEPFSHLTLPIMFPALYAASEGHWSNSIGALVDLKIY